MPPTIDGLPDFCGHEALVVEAMAEPGPRCLPENDADFRHVASGFAVALHMHQPLIPAGSGDLHAAPIISNLQHMMEHPDEGDNHNARVFHDCYRRMGEIIPGLLARGMQPRVMLDYSGCLLHGMMQMGLDDVFDALRPLAEEPARRRCVEWLGATWGHAVAPSTPVHDYRLHVRAWQHHFAAIFGFDALSRVRGFSPAEMALPNHPDVAFEFVRTLRDCGYRWLLVQEHTVERVEDGGPVRRPHVPHRLVARNSRGQVLGITAIIKTQGSDTKLVGQMQPYYESRDLSRVHLGEESIPPLVTQIGDGENGNVMMNEFPPRYVDVMEEASGSSCRPMNVTEYLEHLDRLGVSEGDFPQVQPLFQKRIWDRFEDGAGPEALGRLLEELEAEDDRFHVAGGSWTNDISWVEGYEGVLGPMEAVSALFARKVLGPGVPSSDPRYRKALFLLLTSQTSCFRYWGEGLWTDYGRELCRRAREVIEREFGAERRRPGPR